ncbi:MAG: motility associated factor glycosyltransferase family protein [Ruminiclostridium sp.]|nr:motility associated factor glycosyltransferase family protein [Ruminiclostridium sp.]
MSIISHGNALDDMFVGFINNYLNIDAFVRANTIDEIRNKFQGLPAIVVSAGPSLDKNIHLLKNAYGKALIIACDASLRACEKQDVKPDAVASIERDEPTYTYYYKDKIIDKDIVLVAPGVLWPEIYSGFKGKMIIMSKSPDGPEGWWMSHFDAVKYASLGQSSATVAFSVAQMAGCNPIILIGQDLAFTGEKKHSELTHTEHEGENNDREFDGIYLEDVDGNLLKSDWVFKLFKDWFEYKIIASPGLKVIDATEGGAYIKGSEVMRFEEAIEKYCTNKKEKKLIEYLSDVEVSPEKYLDRCERILISISEEIKKIKKIKEDCKKHNKRLLKINKSYKLETCTETELVKVVLEMKKGDKLIRDIKKCKYINAYFNQIIQQTIIYVKAIGNELKNDNVKRNHFLQRNLMYMIIESADLVINEYKKANEFIIRKKGEVQNGGTVVN